MEREPRQAEIEEESGALGPPITEADLRRIQAEVDAEVRAEKARRHLYSRMAANMVIKDEPHGSYFVRKPGL